MGFDPFHPTCQFWSNPVQFVTKEYLGQESDCDVGLQSRIIWAPPDWSRRSQPGRFCRLTSSRSYRQAAVVSTTSFLLSLVNLKPGMPLGPEAFLVAVLMITDCMEKKKLFCQTCSLFFYKEFIWKDNVLMNPRIQGKKRQTPPKKNWARS